MALVQHGHDRRQGRGDQEGPIPVEAPRVRRGLGLGQGEPAQQYADQSHRHVDPEGPLPAQRIEDQAADGRPRPQADRLSRRLQAEAAPVFRGAGGHHDNGDAVRGQERGADALQDAEEDQRRQVGGEAAQARADDEEQEAAEIEQLAAEHVRQPSEDRRERSHREQIGDRDPTHAAEARPEFDFEARQENLRHAGVDLAHARADTDRADDEPSIGLQAGDGGQRRRLLTARHRAPNRLEGKRAW